MFIPIYQESKKVLIKDLPKFRKQTLKEKVFFFCVMKGRISEGIDFPDELARVVIVAGVPYANLGDKKVMFKKEYTAKRYGYSVNWYQDDAYRGVN